MSEGSYSLNLKGLNIDQVYENLVREIAGSELTNNDDDSLKESIIKTDDLNRLKKRIEKLQAKMRKEKQFNKKVKLNDELRNLKEELKKLENGKTEDGVS